VLLKYYIKGYGYECSGVITDRSESFTSGGLT
jgi:hypothetical protein